GQYFRIRNPKKFSITHLVYPPPTEIGLGIHVTPDLAGGLRFGPDAKYVSDIDYNIDEKEKKVFFDSVSKFLPVLEPDDLIPDTAGIRPKLQGKDEGFRDFIIREESEKGFPNFVNLIGIESPGLTSSLAIAEKVKLCLNTR
ncbi:MAG: FAD-dependent oxidoreductase, partial [Candidatus Omnitrophota bacterium]